MRESPYGMNVRARKTERDVERHENNLDDDDYRCVDVRDVYSRR